ncbi:MAG TPA: DUF2948 family protein [Methylomirabilota bacterium]|nr:DUF2948 family protein [Methylomirabilota bacterium]
MEALKLAALDAEDLQVIAAYVQDSVLTVGDIDWRPREKRLVLAINRFAWEKADRADKGFERHRALLHFARVEAVRSARIRRDAPDAVLSLLTVRFEASDAPAGRVYLDFSGGGSLCADVECIEASLADLGVAWATGNRPAHELG